MCFKPGRLTPLMSLLGLISSAFLASQLSLFARETQLWPGCHTGPMAGASRRPEAGEDQPTWKTTLAPWRPQECQGPGDTAAHLLEPLPGAPPAGRGVKPQAVSARCHPLPKQFRGSGRSPPHPQLEGGDGRTWERWERGFQGARERWCVLSARGERCGAAAQPQSRPDGRGRVTGLVCPASTCSPAQWGHACTPLAGRVRGVNTT